MFYLDKDVLFAETCALRDELEAQLDVRFTRVPASLSLEQQAAEHGEALWSHDPNLCCYLHKIVPLQVQLTHPEVSAVLIEGRRI